MGGSTESASHYSSFDTFDTLPEIRGLFARKNVWPGLSGSYGGKLSGYEHDGGPSSGWS